MLVSEKVQEEIKKEQLHVMLVCLKDEVVTEDTGSILPEFPNTVEHG